MNRALARLGGRCEDTSQVIMHDWWLAAVAARFGKVIYIDEPLSDYRQHGGNCVGAKDVGSAGYISEMMANLRGVRRRLLDKKAQAYAFFDTYKIRLNQSDCDFLCSFAKKRSGAVFYVVHRDLIHGMMRALGMILLG